MHPSSRKICTLFILTLSLLFTSCSSQKGELSNTKIVEKKSLPVNKKVEEANELVIKNEKTESPASDSLVEKETVTGTTRSRLLLVAHVRDQAYIIFNSAEADIRALKSDKKKDVSVVNADSLATRTQILDSPKLNKNLLALTSIRLSLYDKRKKRCLAKIKDFVIWQQLAVEDSVEETVWHTYSYALPVLAARLKTVEGDCKGSLFARDEALPAPVFASIGKVSKKNRRKLIKTFRGTSEWKQAQEVADTKLWDAGKGTDSNYEMISSKGVEWAIISARGGEYATASIALRRTKKGKWKKFRVDGTSRMDVLACNQILASFDYDDDGDLDFLCSMYDRGRVFFEQKNDSLYAVHKTPGTLPTD